MTIERHERDRRVDLKMTECEYCGEPLGHQVKFPAHWRSECTANPANGDG